MMLHELIWTGNASHWQEAELPLNAKGRLFRHNGSSPVISQYWPLPYYVSMYDSSETNCDVLEAQCWLYELLGQVNTTEVS